MTDRVVSVRLDEKRLRRLRSLRRCGITLSEIVRRAIDEGYEKFQRSRDTVDVRAVLARLDAAHPLTQEDLPTPGYDVHDRKQARRAVARQLGAKRPPRRLR